ncbi:MAG: hypothetical protein AAGC79_13135 [Pseudomonadota bacterium]
MELSRKTQRQAGFVLLVVLIGLSMLSLLLGASMQTMVTHTKLAEISFKRDREAMLFDGILELAGMQAALSLRQVSTPLADQAFSFEGQSESVTYHVQDVAGLVDLNTAPFELIEKLLADQRNPDQLIVTLADLRQRRTRLSSVDDLQSLPGIDLRRLFEVDTFFTVFSGRRGIDPASAPVALLERLTGQKGSRAKLTDALPSAWIQPPTRRIFKVRATKDGRSFGPESTILITSGATFNIRVLETRR